MANIKPFEQTALPTTSGWVPKAGNVGAAYEQAANQIGQARDELNNLGTQRARALGSAIAGTGALAGAAINLVQAKQNQAKLVAQQQLALTQLSATNDIYKLHAAANAAIPAIQQANINDPDQAVSQVQQLITNSNPSGLSLNDIKTKYALSTQPGKKATIDGQIAYQTVVNHAQEAENSIMAPVRSWALNQGTANAEKMGLNIKNTTLQAISNNTSDDPNNILQGFVTSTQSAASALSQPPVKKFLGEAYAVQHLASINNSSGITAVQRIFNGMPSDPTARLTSIDGLENLVNKGVGPGGNRFNLYLNTNDVKSFNTELNAARNTAYGELALDAKVGETAALYGAGDLKVQAYQAQQNPTTLQTISTQALNQIAVIDKNVTDITNNPKIVPKVKQIMLQGQISQRAQYEGALKEAQSYNVAFDNRLHGEAVAAAKQQKEINAADHRAALDQINTGINQIAQLATDPSTLGVNAEQILSAATVLAGQVEERRQANALTPEESQRYIKQLATLTQTSAEYKKTDPGWGWLIGQRSQVVQQKGQAADQARMTAQSKFYSALNSLKGSQKQTSVDAKLYNFTPTQTTQLSGLVATWEKANPGKTLAPAALELFRQHVIDSNPAPVKVVPSKAQPKVSGHKADTKSGFVPPPPPDVKSMVDQGGPKTIQEMMAEANKPLLEEIKKLKSQVANLSKGQPAEAATAPTGMQATAGKL